MLSRLASEILLKKLLILVHLKILEYLRLKMLNKFAKLVAIL